MEKYFGIEVIELRKKVLIGSEDFDLKIDLDKEGDVIYAGLYKNDKCINDYSLFTNKIQYIDILDFSYKFIASYFKDEKEKQKSIESFENWDGIIDKKSLIKYEV